MDCTTEEIDQVFFIIKQEMLRPFTIHNMDLERCINVIRSYPMEEIKPIREDQVDTVRQELPIIRITEHAIEIPAIDSLESTLFSRLNIPNSDQTESHTIGNLVRFEPYLGYDTGIVLRLMYEFKLMEIFEITFFKYCNF